ncbi:MAG: hypothetical protein CMM07_14715 [Rhodopirellula sp.]|nr:hypothetical protein [Rhodopirellula sp.]
MSGFENVVVSLREFRKFGLDQILDWVTAKRKAFYFEPSSRFDTQGLHEKRGLFYLPSADFRVKDRDLLTETLFLMNAPARFRENIFRFLPAAQGIHFGFDQRELDQSQASLICKCYLEFPGSSAATTSQTTQFLGYKWSPLGLGSPVVSKYRLIGDGDVNEAFATWESKMKTRAVSGYWSDFDFERLKSNNHTDRREQLGASHSQEASCHVLQIQDEGSERYSVDVNLYSQQWKVRELSTQLRQTLVFSPVKQDQWDKWIQNTNHQTVGHISTGYDRGGQPFLTLYHGSHLLVSEEA